jgi:hypothetical protein
MLSEPASRALDALRRLGWNVALHEQRGPLPDAVLRRYPAIPEPAREFLEHLDTCERNDETVWFLTAADYAGAGGSSYAWDEGERIARESAGPESEADSRAFWDAHLPILQSVEGDYAFLGICVDRGSPRYGEIVRGDHPDLESPTTVSASFGELLDKISAAVSGSLQPNLFDLLLHPDDPRRLASAAPATAVGRMRARIRERILSRRPFERYRIGVVVEEEFSRPLYSWDNWSTITPALSSIIDTIGEPAEIETNQRGSEAHWLQFGPLPWSEESNRKWTTQYLADPARAGTVHFFLTEIWCPSRETALAARRGPKLFCLIHRHENAGQGFVLAIRTDVLPRVGVAADAAIFSVRALLDSPKHAVFERKWGEVGRFAGMISVSGLETTSPDTVLHWAQRRPRSHVRSFRAP